MCSILTTNRAIENVEDVNFYLKYRGPDHTEIIRDRGWLFIHNLLSITGDFTPQPLTKNNVYLSFNGEIYNFLNEKNYSSDGYFILDQYLEKGEDFIKYLDGEFALTLIDFDKNLLFFSGDLFCTKPLYYALEEKEIGISSYKSSLEKLKFTNIKRVNPNTIYKLDINNWNLSLSSNYNWNLSQTQDTYEIWEQSFLKSLEKRTQFTRADILVPMSSGYDSGAIVCGLQLLQKRFITYSFYGNEDLSIINKRLLNHADKLFKGSISQTEYQWVLQQMNEFVEPFYYGPNPDYKTHNGFDDRGAIGLFYLLNDVKNQKGIKVQLSGQGGDEITGNLQTYGFQTRNPVIWPDKLDSIFPWGNFYYGANWSYLNKEECVAGSLGIETRYPLLDKDVVQSFINLTPKYKNKAYKAPLKAFFEKYNFPFKEEKLGFNLQVL
jgi:asparagine synthetase B (glutamine-hydrolysing)